MKVLNVCRYVTERIIHVQGVHWTARLAAKTKAGLISESLVRARNEGILLSFVSIMSSERTAGGWLTPFLHGGRTITGPVQAVVSDVACGRAGNPVQMPSAGSGR
jgi:hypothetical protein